MSLRQGSDQHREMPSNLLPSNPPSLPVEGTLQLLRATLLEHQLMLADQRTARKTVVQAILTIGHLSLNCLIDTGATLSCISMALADSLLSHGSAQESGSEFLSLDTADGMARSRYRIITAHVTYPHAPSFRIEERFVVLPKISSDTVLLGMSFMDHPQVGCVVDIPNAAIRFHNHDCGLGQPLSIPFTGQVRRSLTLVASRDTMIPPYDETNRRAFAEVPVHSPAADCTADGPVRQSPDAVLNLCILTAVSHCKLTQGKCMLPFCNLSPEPVTVKAGTPIAEWFPPPRAYVITLPDGTHLRQDSATPESLTTKEAPSAPQGPIYGENNLSDAQRELLRQCVEQSGALNPPIPGMFTPTITCSIQLKPGMTGPSSRPYHSSPSDRATIAGLVAELISNGTAVESNSPFASPVHLVRKAGKVRLVMDYRALNAATVRQIWPAARIDNILSSFSGAQVFSVLDLNAAFHQIAFSSEKDAELAAFVTEDGHYQMRAMPFGLTNAPAIMQRLIDKVLTPHKKYALAYMDDIIIFSSDFATHLEQLSAVLKTLCEHKLAVKASKCRFAQRQVRFLGFVVSDLGISTDPAYVRAVSEFPSPNDPMLPHAKKIARILEFCGMVGYYRRFARCLGTLEKPLRTLACSHT